MTDTPIRIDGWKAIAAHFRRDRSTVIRWAEAGDFPVHRVSRRKGASVWAYAHELDAWLVRGGGPARDQNPVPSRRWRWRGAVASAGLGVGAVMTVVAVAAALLLNHNPAAAPAPTAAMPSEASVAEIYLQARDDWSTRSPEGLRKSIAEFGEVTSREPAFAPGYTGLADAYLLEHQFENVPDSIAFAKAEAAAKAALAIDPNSAGANRDLGFIAYWDHKDVAAARRYFDRAIRLAPSDAQTHYWYANMLYSSGAREEGLGQFRAARLLAPGSLPIQIDYAWSLWNLGPGDPGLAQLQGIADRATTSASAHRWLSYIYLTRGEVGRYLDEGDKWAALQNNDLLKARFATERAAYRRGGAAAALDAIARRSPSARFNEASGTEWPATGASLAGRRNQLLAILLSAEAHHEHWDTWRKDQSRYARWRGDQEITDRLDRLGSREPGPSRPN